MSAFVALRWPGAPAAGRVEDGLRAYPYTALVLGVGLLVRAVLVPLTYGGDFGMWSLTAAATLRGQDTYSQPLLPIDQAGPYAYFPLYLYILLPLKWLAEHLVLPYVVLGGAPAVHTNLSYVILGKLPVVVGDVGVAVALAGMLRRAGLSDRACALGAALFFLNPLVLYNGPFYGRFDSLCLTALLVAWRQLEPEPVRGRRLALWYALGVTLKTFPIFLLPYVVLRAGLRRGLGVALAALALPVAVSLPYLLHNAHRFIYIVFVYDSTKGPRQFSWQFALLDLGLHLQAVKQISYVLLALFAVLLMLCTRARPLSQATGDRRQATGKWPHVAGERHAPASLSPALRERGLSASLRGEGGLADPYAYVAVAFTLFLLLSKVLYEQYFLWPLPFLAILVVRDRARMAALLLMVLSVTGLLANDWIHPFGYRPAPALWLNALIAVAAASFVAAHLRGRAAHAGRHTSGAKTPEAPIAAR